MSGKKVVTWLFVLMGCTFVLGMCVAYTLYTQTMKTPPPLMSPDETMMASLSVTDSRGEKNTHMRLVVDIKGKMGEDLLRRQTTASAMREYDLKWISDTRLRLRSTEIGDLEWVKGEDGVWRDVLLNGDRVVPAVPGAPETPK